MSGASKAKNKDREMAAYLKRSGRPHGVTGTHTHSVHPPKFTDVGSAAYRRRMFK